MSKPVAGHDVVVVGGGHNGLVAAILAASGGQSVLLLERSPHLGGATLGEPVFAGRPTRLSRYSYLVSLFPDDLAAELGIALPLASRITSSYTPTVRDGHASGLLVERSPGAATEASFAALTGGASEFRAWQQLYGELAAMAAALAPHLRGPMLRRTQVQKRVIGAAGQQLWTDLFEQPLSEMLLRRFADDTVRGIVATDALIGTFTSLTDESLLANRCFLYHLIGRGTGEWQVPIGGMGALSDALWERARAVGVQIRTNFSVDAVTETAEGVVVTGETVRGGRLNFPAAYLLAAVAPVVLDGWRGVDSVKPVGSQLKVNMLLDRLPQLASGIDPAIAFAGTMHLEEGYEQLEQAYRASAAGEVGEHLPSEVYCHSLSDTSILNGERAHTLTLFGLHTPRRCSKQTRRGPLVR
ncbi:phytoene desaturase family protein [Nakamurella antarctica]|uniref:phytoene desaturase family protein n=1 Tax=Nakamurella antarctica TaxID=1902245 RepID=UPI0019CFAAF9|nr:FAD-dependent oxidoreductase [Nakamurella antarctica]